MTPIQRAFHKFCKYADIRNKAKSKRIKKKNHKLCCKWYVEYRILKSFHNLFEQFADVNDIGWGDCVFELSPNELFITEEKQ